MSFVPPSTLAAALRAARQGALGGGEGPGAGRVLVRGEAPTSWRALAEEAARVGAGLSERGVGPGERVLLVLPTSGAALTTLFGCFHAGVAPCFLAPPAGVGSEATFRRVLAQIVALTQVSGVVTTAALAPLIGEVVPGTPCWIAVALSAEQASEPVERSPESIAYVQLTSGTTKLPKAAQISERALVANVTQIGRRLSVAPGHACVSWLPLFHDMGLFGCLLTPFFHAMDVHLSRPMSFLRRPLTWLRAIGEQQARVYSAAPSFAYRYVVKRCQPDDLQGLDLSRWDTALVGAEPIHDAVLRAFHERLAPCGLPETTLRPCYGLAEATLAVTITPRERRYTRRSVSRSALAERGVATEPESAEDALPLVGCGEALEGTLVEVQDDDGHSLPPGQLGELVVRGPSLFSTYLGLDREASGFRGDALRTGDLGFVHEGQLYVTGRQKDVIILRGHNHHPEEVEWVVAQVAGVRAGRVAAFGVSDSKRGTDRLCVLFEAESKTDRDALSLAVRRRVADESGLTIDGLLAVDRGTIALTTSGKIRRGHARDLFLQLEAESAEASA